MAETDKINDLKRDTVEGKADSIMTTDHGVKVRDTDNWYVSSYGRASLILKKMISKGLKYLTESTAVPLCLKIRSLGRKFIVSITNEFQSASSTLEVSVPMVTSGSLTTELPNIHLLQFCLIRQGPLQFSFALVQCRVPVAALLAPDLFIHQESNLLL